MESITSITDEYKNFLTFFELDSLLSQVYHMLIVNNDLAKYIDRKFKDGHDGDEVNYQLMLALDAWLN